MLRLSGALRRRHILSWMLLASALLRPTSSDLLQNKHEAVDRQPQQRLRGTPADVGDDAGQPEQIHLALQVAAGGRDMYAMSVSWLTWGEAKSPSLLVPRYGHGRSLCRGGRRRQRYEIHDSLHQPRPGAIHERAAAFGGNRGSGAVDHDFLLCRRRGPCAEHRPKLHDAWRLRS
ncbi:unnamed protein product [Ectocarpus fasciculatus]